MLEYLSQTWWFWGTGLAFGFGASLPLGLTPRRYIAARVCFAVSAVVLAAWVVRFSLAVVPPRWPRAVVLIGGLGIVAAAWTWTWRISRPLVTLADAVWKEEMGGFRDAASAVWKTLVPKFEQHGFWGAGSLRNGLDAAVRGATWPDETPSEDDAVVVHTEALRAFAEKVAAQSGEHVFQQTADYLVFDQARRQLSDVVRDWSARIDQQGFLDWLRTHLDWPYHARTMKLLWYLELGVAAASHNEQVDCRFLATLRDALRSAPAPPDA
jgi:hypothetical protein